MRFRRYLSYANVTATLALVFAMAGGAAYAMDKINSHDVVNGSLKSIDLKNHQGVRGADVKHDSLTGRQIDERTLHAGGIAKVVGHETDTCVLLLTPVNCVQTGLALERPSRVLVVATGNEESLNGAAQASCRIRIDGISEPLAVEPGEAATDNTSATATNGFARTLISRDPLIAGHHTIALTCKRLVGQARVDSPTIAAVAVGSR